MSVVFSWCDSLHVEVCLCDFYCFVCFAVVICCALVLYAAAFEDVWLCAT